MARSRGRQIVRTDADYDIVMLVLNDMVYDGRVRREASALASASWRVLVIGSQRAQGDLPDEETVQGFTLRRVRYGRYGASLRRPWRWFRHGLQAIQIVHALRKVTPRAYHAHDLPALLLVYGVWWPRRRRCALVYDSHELYLFLPPQPSRWLNTWHRLTRPLFLWLEGWMARHANAVIMVCEPSARALAWWHHLPRPVVVHNGIDPVGQGELHDPHVEAVRGVMQDGRRWVVHTGEITNWGRSLTELVQALALLPDDMALALLGYGAAADDLRRLAVSLGIGGRVVVIPPVQPELVPAAIQGASVAAALLRPDSWHIRATLPNKLFEAVAAGVPVVASNTFGLRRIVSRYELGLLCDPTDPAAVAAALRQILEPENQVKFRQRVQAAQTVINWQAEAAKLCAVYEGLLS